MFAVNGILFNHESPRRGETFVSRKITRAVCRIKLGVQEELRLGNLNAKRDWGHARDYVRGMWLMLQADEPQDFVLSTGVTRSVREFTEKAFKHVGIEISWQGHGVSEVGVNKETGHAVVRVDERYFRPSEVDILLGDSTKARTELKWNERFSFDDLVRDMMDADMDEAVQEKQYNEYRRQVPPP
eukprot:GFYU01018855.1.p1 GENE.GFYU01018855.1~~GFYU01018855.1.p1  ORF type:complete len:210 (+),score=59.44 GFYU01018855.1:76-630(+)